MVGYTVGNVEENIIAVLCQQNQFYSLLDSDIKTWLFATNASNDGRCIYFENSDFKLHSEDCGLDSKILCDRPTENDYCGIKMNCTLTTTSVTSSSSTTASTPSTCTSSAASTSTPTTTLSSSSSKTTTTTLAINSTTTTAAAGGGGTAVPTTNGSSNGDENCQNTCRKGSVKLSGWCIPWWIFLILGLLLLLLLLCCLAWLLHCCCKVLVCRCQKNMQSRPSNCTKESQTDDYEPEVICTAPTVKNVETLPPTKEAVFVQAPVHSISFDDEEIPVVKTVKNVDRVPYDDEEFANDYIPTPVEVAEVREPVVIAPAHEDGPEEFPTSAASIMDAPDSPEETPRFKHNKRPGDLPIVITPPQYSNGSQQLHPSPASPPLTPVGEPFEPFNASRLSSPIRSPRLPSTPVKQKRSAVSPPPPQTPRRSRSSASRERQPASPVFASPRKSPPVSDISKVSRHFPQKSSQPERSDSANSMPTKRMPRLNNEPKAAPSRASRTRSLPQNSRASNSGGRASQQSSANDPFGRRSRGVHGGIVAGGNPGQAPITWKPWAKSPNPFTQNPGFLNDS